MSNKGKIIAAAIIWIGVCFFGYRMYQKIAPAMFGLPRDRGGRGGGGREAWQAQQKEIEEFLKADIGSSIKLSVKKNKSGMGNSQSQENDKGFHFIGYNMQIEDVYASLAQKPNWQVMQVPQNAERWDVKMRGPKADRKLAAQTFLNYMKWQAKEQTIPAQGYRFVSSGGTLSAPAQNDRQRRGGMQIPPLELKQYAENMQWMFRAPVAVDDDVASRKPVNSGTRIPWQRNPDDAAALVAAAFGVGVKKDPVQTKATLLYHPKYSSNIDIRKWEQGLLERN